MTGSTRTRAVNKTLTQNVAVFTAVQGEYEFRTCCDRDNIFKRDDPGKWKPCCVVILFH